jgi:hypothetical protein
LRPFLFKPFTVGIVNLEAVNITPLGRVIAVLLRFGILAADLVEPLYPLSLGTLGSHFGDLLLVCWVIAHSLFPFVAFQHYVK